MKTINRLSVAVALAAAAMSCCRAAGMARTNTLFEAGQDGYYTYRIASLAASKRGSLLAFCAARKGSGGDWDPIDIVLRRSPDGGTTWEPMRVLVHHEGAPCDNATPIVDFATGEIHLLYQVDYSRCYYCKSLDEGLSWTPALEITATIDAFKKAYPWVVLAPGPGHGIQLANGRLVVPFWLSNGGGQKSASGHRGHRPSIVVSVFSDDHGKTWKAGEVAVPDNDVTVIPNETSCVQLADGRVLFNSRNESSRYQRLFTFSRDGATGWSEPAFCEALFDPICFGSMCRYSLQPYQSKNRILFCNPDSRLDPWIAPKAASPRSAKPRHRTNLTVRLSYDEGATWPVSKLLDPGIAGYSDLAVTPDGVIHVLYEGGAIAGTGNNQYKNTRITLVSFDLPWLTGGKDRLAKSDVPLNQFQR